MNGSVTDPVTIISFGYDGHAYSVVVPELVVILVLVFAVPWLVRMSFR